MVKRTSLSLESSKYKLNKKDGKKILKGFGIAMGGAAAAFAFNLLPQVDWGQYTYVVVPIASVVLNVIVKACRGK